VKQHLSALLPYFTYKLQECHSQRLHAKETVKLAEVMFQNLKRNEATDAVAAALEEEPKQTPETLESTIKEIVSEEIKNRSSKNLSGGLKTQTSLPKPNGSHTASTPVMTNKKLNTVSSLNKNKRKKVEQDERRNLRQKTRELQDELR